MFLFVCFGFFFSEPYFCLASLFNFLSNVNFSLFLNKFYAC